MLDKFTYEGNNRKVIERFLLAAYSVYGVIMIILSIIRGWNVWITNSIIVSLIACWFVHMLKSKEYEFKARTCVIIMQISLIIYAANLDEISSILPIFIVFVVLSGLYGIASLIYITMFSGAIIFLYHGLVLKSFPCTTVDDNISILVQIGNIIIAQYIIYIWVKRNSEGSKKLLDTIIELEEVEISKDDFLANVSHEIRTPINTICGISEIVLKEDLPESVKADILGIQQAGRNLMSVVRDILDFSELQSGKIELEEETYNISSTINDVINMTLAKKNEKNIELIVDCDANIPCGLLGDEKKLRRIIMNLVDNAIKFTEEGFVSITIGYRRETYGMNLVITVKDTGIGMDAENIEKLFVGFSQGDGSRSRQEGGVGLGLAITYALANKMGAAITIKSKRGKGTTIKVVVPQKILDEKPIAAIDDRKNVNVATYIDMEQFGMMEIRDEYTNNIIHMVKQLQGKCHICRNFAELQRREQREIFSHIFISDVEYRVDTKYFDELAERTNLVVVLDRDDEQYVTNPNIIKIYKPYFILPIVSVLNSPYDNDGKNILKKGKFVTRNTHVLVVDDNLMNIRVIEGFLEEYGIKVTRAISGNEALEKINSADYDFVFMDHMMPEMDGVETLKRIRSKVGAYYQSVPIIALTANAVAGAREMLIENGFNDFLEKPVERFVLERVLQRNLAHDKIVYITEDVVKESVKENIEAETDNETDSSVKDILKQLESLGININEGILYCNGEDRYIEILKGFCEDSNSTGKLADKLYESADWKNYTIAVHGMKSSMRSIGATDISGLAAELEKAGKSNDIEYIKEKHEELSRRYNEMYNNLCQCLMPDKENEEETILEELPEINEEEFDSMLSEMDGAVYALDGKKMLEILSELQKYSFGGKSLKEALSPAVRKVEMSDYFSAMDMVISVKEKLPGKEV